MRSGGVVGEALERLRRAGLLTEVCDLRSVERVSGETLRVSVPVWAPTRVRQAIVAALDGLPFEWVDDERPRRGVVTGFEGLKDDRVWRMGIQDDVAWIRDQTASGLTITSAIPPVFDAYATVVVPNDDDARALTESELLRVLTERSADQLWWLGYLDTGGQDLVFDRAPTVTLYAGWKYVMVEAGPTQAWTWREDDPWRGRLPDLIYPTDHSWLVSMLWDDDWRCLGGPRQLIEAVLTEPALDSRQVGLNEPATPPGHIAY